MNNDFNEFPRNSEVFLHVTRARSSHETRQCRSVLLAVKRTMVRGHRGHKWRKGQRRALLHSKYFPSKPKLSFTALASSLAVWKTPIGCASFQTRCSSAESPAPYHGYLSRYLPRETPLVRAPNWLGSLLGTSGATKMGNSDRQKLFVSLLPRLFHLLSGICYDFVEIFHCG